jgi:hypothetical protein
VWRRRCERLLEREMGLLSEVQQQTADVQAEVLRVQKVNLSPHFIS